jgi:hypothetical protein
MGNQYADTVLARVLHPDPNTQFLPNPTVIVRYASP